MNKQGREKRYSSIGWTDYTWNPIKGMCPVNCKTPDGKEYCYARKMYKRFGWQRGLIFDWGEVHAPRKLKIPSKIFVCSTIEMFHPKIPKEYRDGIFRTIESCPQHTFQILTKFPENIDRAMPDNVWLGVTITGENDEVRTDALIEAKARIKFISCEPMLLDCKDIIYSFDDIDWLILGRLTGHGKKYDPACSILCDFVDATEEHNIPLFMKDNLKSSWGNAPLIQEFPE